MKKALTADNTFNEGSNVVITRGTEFAEEKEVYIQGLGPRDVETEVVLFNEIDTGDIENYHTPHGKGYSALLGLLRKQHGSNFDEGEQVTVLRFNKKREEAPVPIKAAPSPEEATAQRITNDRATTPEVDAETATSEPLDVAKAEEDYPPAKKWGGSSYSNS